MYKIRGGRRLYILDEYNKVKKIRKKTHLFKSEHEEVYIVPIPIVKMNRNYQTTKGQLDNRILIKKELDFIGGPGIYKLSNKYFIVEYAYYFF